ncbi:MAG: hypothetical protein II393_01260 [Cytophagales bacterium]|nr:hypothetical protein [Cytophagales bacterium]
MDFIGGKITHLRVRILIFLVLISFYKISIYPKDNYLGKWEGPITPVKDFVRFYGGVNVPIPTFLFTHKKYINCIESECVSTGLKAEEREDLVIFDEITKYNTDNNTSINDCVKFNTSINNFVALYQGTDKKEKICYPFLALNSINSFLVISKLNTYFSLVTELKHNLLGSTDYNTAIQQKLTDINNNKKCDVKMKAAINVYSFLKKLVNDKTQGLSYEQKLDFLRLKMLQQDKTAEQILSKNIKSLWKRLNIIPLQVGISWTHWFNNKFGIDLNMPFTFVYFKYSHTLGLPKLEDNTISFLNSNILPCVIDGHIVNHKELKRVSNINSCVGAMSTAFLFYVKNNYNDTKDVATNYYVSNFFDLDTIKIAFLNIRLKLIQASGAFKIGFVFNLNPYNGLLKHGGRLINNIHQIAISPGATVSHATIKVDIDINEDCYEDDKPVENETQELKKTQYEDTKKTYTDIIIGKNTEHEYVKKISNLITFIENDFMPKYKVLPTLEIKYRFQKKTGFTVEVGTRLFFRTFFNITINKQEMLDYWNNEATKAHQYDKNTTEDELKARKEDIINKIKSFTGPLGIDLGFFISIGFSWVI